MPSALTPERVAAADVVAAMKPDLPISQLDGVRYETWTLPDPNGWDVEAVRPLREHIAEQVSQLLAPNGPSA